MPSLTDQDLRALGQPSRLCGRCVDEAEASAWCAACASNAQLVRDLRAIAFRLCPQERLLLEISFPLRLVSPLNAREPWRRKADRIAEEKKISTLHLWSRGGRSGARFLPCRVEMVRAYGKGSRAFDTDNAEAAFKGVRDAVAEWVRTGDQEGSGVSWTVRQEPAERDLVRLVFWRSGL